jgi:hypothetical protein
LWLSAFDFDGISPAVGIFLEDVRSGIWHDLREKPDYAFLNEVPGIPQRLILHFTDVTDLATGKSIENIRAFVSADHIYITGNIWGPVTFYLLDLSGRIISQGQATDKIRLNNPAHGLYILFLTSEEGDYRLKIII